MSSDNQGKFTLNYLEWGPWLERAIDTDISDEQRQRILEAVGTTGNVPYVSVLANDYAAWQARARVHRHVFTDESPRSRAYRELASVTASRINGCAYCASGHARIYATALDRRDVAQRFLEDGLEADLPVEERAIVDLAAKVTTDPEGLGPADLEPLRALGFDDFAILDVINYAGFFANANRLMLSLGEPVSQREWHG